MRGTVCIRSLLLARADRWLSMPLSSGPGNPVLSSGMTKSSGWVGRLSEGSERAVCGFHNHRRARRQLLHFAVELHGNGLRGPEVVAADAGLDAEPNRDSA